MARIFLSYAREDLAKAERLAEALEESGHSVWWDRYISSGSEFASAIEQALNDAEAVLVLWSKEAIASGWVRDEAAEARDTKRLIPVLLDKSRPPIGFRQLQALDLSHWNGTASPKELAHLLEAIDRKTGTEVAPTRPNAAVSDTNRFRLSPRIGAAVFALLLVVAGLAYVAVNRSAAAEPPTLAVLPFADLSPERDKGFFTEGLAEEILSFVAREPGIQVIGRSSSSLFQSGAADLEKMRESLGVTHVLEGSARTIGNQLRLSVRLIETVKGTELWAQDYQKELSNIFVVQDEVGRAIADRLRGTLSRPAQKNRAATRPEVYTLYLQARSKMRDRKRESIAEARRLAVQVITADRTYAPGHALYAELTFFSRQTITGCWRRLRHIGLHDRMRSERSPSHQTLLKDMRRWA